MKPIATLGGNIRRCRAAPFHPETLRDFLRYELGIEFGDKIIWAYDENNQRFCYRLTKSVTLYMYWSNYEGGNLEFAVVKNADYPGFDAEEYNAILGRAKKFFLLSLDSFSGRGAENAIVINEDSFLSLLKEIKPRLFL